MVPDGDALFAHTSEGPDDMPAHVRSVLTQNHVTLPIDRGALALGRWQGLFLYEHRAAGSERRITLNLIGVEPALVERRLDLSPQLSERMPVIVQSVLDEIAASQTQHP